MYTEMIRLHTCRFGQTVESQAGAYRIPQDSLQLQIHRQYMPYDLHDHYRSQDHRSNMLAWLNSTR